MTPHIRILRFWTAYETRNGETVERDFVEYCPPGMADKRTTVRTVKSVLSVQPNPDPDNTAAQMSLMTANVVRPAYEAWKKGEQLPEHGTPLAAWAGLSDAQARELKKAELFTIEDVAAMTDAMMDAVNLPDVRRLRTTAQQWLESREDSKVLDALAEKDAKLAALEEQLAEMQAAMSAKPADDDEPKRRGRKPLPRDAEGNVIRDEVAA